ncbi:MAG: hypothetical protein CFE24_10125 [Flavobacterium sp. BFFFF2]|nr:MAG: hypothetical protein CFE24_10125 [Flavobacterium sp. BFFFF2]
MKKREVQLPQEFKSQAKKAIIAIVIFILSYFVILLLAFALTALCVVGGISLIVLKPMLATLALGVGLASLGVLIVIFLLKFIFKSHKTDRSHLIEISESDEPKLFHLINGIVLEVGTSFPKKVYLSADVNASVFYDSSFWSMFLPIKKNLTIGLGLVNTSTEEELKAILAHEFGHFSQRTMKVGSYVYNVNQIIFNMLYDNNSYDHLVEKWANASNYFAIFVGIAVKINGFIQKILIKLYELVNKSYLALSREMEFHADEIAASVTGYEPLKNSLLRMSIADKSYREVLAFYDDKIAENVKTNNVYADQMAVLHFIAQENNYSLKYHLPEITQADQSKFDKSKLVFVNQWDSHPTVNQRIKRLEQTGYTAQHASKALANELFVDIQATQQRLTNFVFKDVFYHSEMAILPNENFTEQYRHNCNLNSFDKIYNGYYNDKNPLSFDVHSVQLPEQSVPFEVLFSDEKIDFIYTSISLQNDIATIKNIVDQLITVKTFDYDGQRYNINEAEKLVQLLEGELFDLNEKVRVNDVAIYTCFKKLESTPHQSQLADLYDEFFQYEQAYQLKLDKYIDLHDRLQFVSETTTIDVISVNLKNIKPIEAALKQEISGLLTDEILKAEMTTDMQELLGKYVSAEWEYFAVNSYVDENLQLLYSAMQQFSYLISRKYFLLKKRLLSYQSELLLGK